MATIQKNFDVALKKGAIGELIIKQLLERKNYVVYQPMTEGAHAFDMLAIKNKESAIALDVKAKAPMNILPATGVNQKAFNEYMSFSIKHKMPFWLFFVDEANKLIYGNTLEQLELPRFLDGKNYPMEFKTKKGVLLRLWHLSTMIKIAHLNDEQVDSLKNYNQRNYNYSPSWN